MVPCSWTVWSAPAHLPWTVINLGKFCDWLDLCEVVGFLHENGMKCAEIIYTSGDRTIANIGKS